jgi:hypothetical protein
MQIESQVAGTICLPFQRLLSATIQAILAKSRDRHLLMPSGRKILLSV